MTSRLWAGMRAVAEGPGAAGRTTIGRPETNPDDRFVELLAYVGEVGAEAARLANALDRTSFERTNGGCRAIVGQRRDHDDRGGKRLHDFANCRDAVKPGHFHVHRDDVRTKFEGALDAF